MFNSRRVVSVGLPGTVAEAQSNDFYLHNGPTITTPMVVIRGLRKKEEMMRGT